MLRETGGRAMQFMLCKLLERPFSLTLFEFLCCICVQLVMCKLYGNVLIILVQMMQTEYL